MHGLFGYVLDFQSDSFLFRLQMQFDIMTQDFAYSNLVPIFMKKNVVEFKTGNCKLRAESGACAQICGEKF